MNDHHFSKSRRFLVRLHRVLAAAFYVLVISVGGYYLLNHADSPLPRHWNPVEPLVVSDPVTPLTGWKLRRTLDDPELCRAAVGGAGAVAALPDIRDSASCFVDNRMRISRLGQARVSRLETSCPVALRTAMWEHHGLQPAAEDIYGSSVASIQHFGSYSCRSVRGSGAAGGTTRWSTHAQAMALDVSGFVLENGRRIDLQQDWERTGPNARFLRQARDTACDWFATTLGPDYNALHADHFHLQAVGWGTCR